MKKKIEIYYECFGKGEPVVLLSGLNADRLFWSSSMPYLKDHFYIITLDNRGVGKSQIFTPVCTTKLMAQDVISILDDLKIQKANIVGHSLGGCIAQQLAILYPDRVNKLILCSTQAKAQSISRIATQTIIEMMMANVPRELIVKNVLVRLYSNHFLSDEDRLKYLIDFSLAQPAEESRRSFLYQANALLEHDTSHVLNKILSMTLIIAGEEDITIPIANAHYLAKNISSATLITVPNMAHMLPIENPQYFCDRILNFLG